ncbi:MAG: sensor histidine kinase [Chromatiales bacterium]|jgi:two-component system sensor histidine kinase AlgZ
MALTETDASSLAPARPVARPGVAAQAEGEQACFLPDFCSARLVFLVVLIAELLALVLALASSAYSRDFWGDLALSSLFIQWAALGTAAVLCTTRRWVNSLSTLRAALSAFALTLLVTAVCSLVTVAAQQSGLLPLPVSMDWRHEFVLRNLAVCAIVAAIAFRYFYVQYQWKQNVEAEARSRIQALQARIRPHFLFNSMNTIANLTRSHPEQAEAAVEDLADLFRATLDQRERIPLGEELDIARRYLSIEALRLGDRLTLDWTIEDSLPMSVEIPALTLQPLIENAVYHGVEPLTEGGRITVRGWCQGRDVLFSVANPLPPSRLGRRRPGNRMAQDNVRQRLQLAYGERASMEIAEYGESYVVTVRIPREEEQ